MQATKKYILMKIGKLNKKNKNFETEMFVNIRIQYRQLFTTKLVQHHQFKLYDLVDIAHQLMWIHMMDKMIHISMFPVVSLDTVT